MPIKRIIDMSGATENGGTDSTKGTVIVATIGGGSGDISRQDEGTGLFGPKNRAPKIAPAVRRSFTL